MSNFIGKVKGFFMKIVRLVINVAKTFWNLILTIIQGQLFARESVEKFIFHFFAAVGVLIMFLLARYGMEQTFYRLEETKDELRHNKILYTERLYDYEKSQSIGNVLYQLGENNSNIDIPKNAPIDLEQFANEHQSITNTENNTENK